MQSLGLDGRNHVSAVHTRRLPDRAVPAVMALLEMVACAPSDGHGSLFRAVCEAAANRLSPLVPVALA